MSVRLLVVRLGSLGDLVHTLPAVAALRAAFPSARIDWLVETRWRELLTLNPNLTSVCTADTQRWRHNLLDRESWRSVIQLIQTLRGVHYDTALDFQGLYKSAVLTSLSGARERIGFHERALKEPGASLFYTRRVWPPEGKHVVEMNLTLAAAVGPPTNRSGSPGVDADAGSSLLRFPMVTSPDEEAEVERLLETNHVRDFFLLSPGGGWGAKCWPIERYARLHNALARERGWRSIVNIGPGEEVLVNELVARARVTRPLHFHLSLRQLVALIRRARVVISGDTGPLHLAAALGTPAVGLYGPTDPARNGPYATGPGRVAVIHHRQLATITYKRDPRPGAAILAITVEEVLREVSGVVERTGVRDSPLTPPSPRLDKERE